MQAQHVGRPARGARDAVDVQIGRIGRQHRARPRHAVQLGEHRQLDVHVLEHGLDDQVRLAQRVIRGGALPAVHAGRAFVLAHAALAHESRVDLIDPRAAARQRRLVLFHHHHRQPRVEQRHGDARAHGAAAHHADALQPARPGLLQLGNAPGPPFGVEGVLDGGARHRIRAGLAQRRVQRGVGLGVQEVDWGSPAAGPSAWRVPALAWAVMACVSLAISVAGFFIAGPPSQATDPWGRGVRGFMDRLKRSTPCA